MMMQFQKFVRLIHRNDFCATAVNKSIKIKNNFMLIGKISPEDYNLHPSLYPWARKLYDQAIANTWYPHEIPLKEDLEDWANMTDDEKYAVQFVLSFFNPAELIVNRVLALGVYPYIKSSECHLYLAKQMWEEANHCVA